MDPENLKALWKRCFPQDTDSFIDFYFKEVYREEESLVHIENGQVVAFLQMISYNIKIGKTIHPSIYLSGVMTHPDYRRKGYMNQLLQKAFDEMKCRKKAFVFLIPQEEYLFDFYAKFGFERAFPSPIFGKFNRKKWQHPSVQIYRNINEIDVNQFYTIYSEGLNSIENVVLKSKQQFTNQLWDFFNDGGILLVKEEEMAFVNIYNEQIELKECFCSAMKIEMGKSYRAMIKSLNGSVPEKNIYMTQMLN